MTAPDATINGDLPTIYQALASVKRAVGPVAKTQRNESQNYNFRGIDAVVNAVAPHLDEHGVIPVPVLQKRDYSTVEVGQKRTSMGYVQIEVAYRFYGPLGDYIEAVVPGEAMDSGDKAGSKAMSVAFRTALLQVLNLPTDDPDPDSQSYDRSAADVDDGDWGDYPAKIEALTNVAEARALDGLLRGDHQNGVVTTAKAKNIRDAIFAKVKTFPPEPAAQADSQGEPGADAEGAQDTPAAQQGNGRAPRKTAQDANDLVGDPELADLLLRLANAKTIAELEKVRDDAKAAGKWSAKVPNGKGTSTFSMVVVERKTFIEEAAKAADQERMFADANGAVAGRS
jgi:hypothetical protein